MKGSEHLVLRARLSFAVLVFIGVCVCFYRNKKPSLLPPGPMLGGFHSLPPKPEEKSLSVETVSVRSQSVNRNLSDKRHGN